MSRYCKHGIDPRNCYECPSAKGSDALTCSDSSPKDTTCDCCDKPPTKTMNDKTSQWCVNWFVAYYCDDCFAEVERIMKQTVEEEAAQAAINPNAKAQTPPTENQTNDDE